jgi:hypothetical protein
MGFQLFFDNLNIGFFNGGYNVCLAHKRLSLWKVLLGCVKIYIALQKINGEKHE